MRSLVDYRELDTDLIMRGFYDWLFEASPLLHRMAVREVKGNGIKYNVATTRKGASWTQPGDTIAESTGTATQRSAALSILIGDADVDKFSIATNMSQDVEALEIKTAADDVLFEWSERLIIGQTTNQSTTNQPKGLFKLIAEVESDSTTDLDAPNNTSVIAGNTASGALPFAMMDELTDAVRMGVNAYLMTRRMRRKLGDLARAAGNNLMHDRDDLGHMVAMYGGTPVYVDDHLEDAYPDSGASILDVSSYTPNTTRASGNDNSVIFALHIAEDGFTIIQAAPFQHEVIGTVQNKDAIRHRFKWYTGFALYNKYAAAALTGVLDTAL